jgi:hypothetical protein
LTSKTLYGGDVGDLPFRPEDNVILLLQDVHRTTQVDQVGVVIQMLRNIIHGGMSSGSYAQEAGLGTRGRRMTILVTPTDRLPDDFPEAEPIIVPLPDTKALSKIATDVFDDQVEANGITPPAEDVIHTLAQAGLGLGVQQFEDALSLAMASRLGYHKTDGITDVAAMVDAIEQQKALKIARVPGLDYIRLDDLPAAELPGYERMYEELAMGMQITPAQQLRHKMPGIGGIGIVGEPGTGKSMAALTAARHLRRMCLKLDLGATRGGIVGESEKNMRRVLQIADAMGAFLWLDDVDKAGLSGAAQGRDGDSGVGGRMLNMLLTYMAGQPRAVIALTLNRLSNVPPELMRAGRIDNLFYVRPPCPTNRTKIAQVHMRRHLVEVDDQEKFETTILAHTEDWVGAELADWVLKATRRALVAGTDRLDTVWMEQYAQEFTPQSKRVANREDLDDIKRAGSQLIMIGRTDLAQRVAAKPAVARGRRGAL